MTNLAVATIPKHKIGKWTTLKSAIKTADLPDTRPFDAAFGQVDRSVLIGLPVFLKRRSRLSYRRGIERNWSPAPLYGPLGPENACP